MGKDRDKVRAKKGVQASSSSRTQELLEKSSSSSGGINPFLAASAQVFGGGGGSGLGSDTSSVLTSILIDEQLPGDVRVVFKKLQKKDAITKIKALCELEQILGAPPPPVRDDDEDYYGPPRSRDPSVERGSSSSRTPEEIEDLSKSLLPHWTKAYQKLVVDDNRKVREQAQLTLCQICRNVGRNLAPQLKQLMPSWYLAQHDLYSPVAYSARKAFGTVFPTEQKQGEVLRFCRAELVKGVVDNLQYLQDSTGGRGKNNDEGQGKGNKKGKKKGPGPEEQLQQPAEEQQTPPPSLPPPSPMDSETYALRITCASLSALNSIITSPALLDPSAGTLDQVFGQNGVFWGSGEVTRELLVRRSMYDLLASLSNYLKNKKNNQQEEEDQEEFQFPVDKCVKFINLSFASAGKETHFRNLWNAFLLLTLNGVLSDPQLVKKQLISGCKQGFYGNAGHVGPTLLPLFKTLWGKGQDKPGLSSDVVTSLITGYQGEKQRSSLFERASIARTLAEVVAFILNNEGVPGDFLDMRGVVYPFVFANLDNLTPDFPKIFGSLVQKKVYYEEMLEHVFTRPREIYNSPQFGHFIINLCSGRNSPEDQKNSEEGSPRFKRRVQFQQQGPAEDLRSRRANTNNTKTSPLSFSSLPQDKQTFIQTLVNKLVSTKSYKPLTVISTKFKNQREIWAQVPNLVEALTIPKDKDEDNEEEEDKLVRLQLYLELINLFPEVPSLLSKISDEFEQNFQQDFPLFLNHLMGYLDLQPIRRWVKMDHFSGKIKSVLKNNIQESELETLLKFIFTPQLFPSEFITSVVQDLIDNLKDSSILEPLSRVLGKGEVLKGHEPLLTPVYKYYWDKYVEVSLKEKERDVSSTVEGGDNQESLSSSSYPNLELLESVCFRNIGVLEPGDISGIIEKYLNSCDKLKEVETLLGIWKRLDFSPYILSPYSMPKTIGPQFLSFLGLHFTYEPEEEEREGQSPPRFSGALHRSILAKSLFKGKLALEQAEEETAEGDVTPLILTLQDILHAQSLCRVWEEVDKSTYSVEPLNVQFSTELDVLSSRLTEKIYEDKGGWKELWGQILERGEQGDALWESKLPLRILMEYCTKAELSPILVRTPTSPDPDSTPFTTQVSHILNLLALNKFEIKDVIPWITEKRVKESDQFQFDILLKQMKNKGLANSLLVITIECIRRTSQKDGGEEFEEFLSLASCWIAAWLKQSKYPNLKNRIDLLWVSNLARGVRLISDKVRSNPPTCPPKFVQEFIEFHAEQLYPTIYSWYHQLLEPVEGEGSSNSFWRLETLLQVSNALVTCPSATLSYIEPDGAKLCETFGKILDPDDATRISLPGRIAAYRILKKVKYDRSGEGDLPIVPPVISRVIEKLLRKLRAQGEDETTLISYLLIWDALLKVQKGSSEFATYVRDKETLLTPLLNTVFLSERIPLENASSKHFEFETLKDPALEPGIPINLLKLGCTVVLAILRNLPYTVRWWWNNQVSRQRDRVFVEKFIVKHLSSRLAAEELGSVKLRDGVDDNVTIHCHSGSNELIAHYRIEETNVTLTISLPLNHPLGPVTVKISDKKLHGKINQLLNTRSHSLSAGLKLWKENLDGLYKDVDECAICFFILHGATKQIPKLACKTCRKKFHAACLYKWFSTSNKSECPLCRNIF